MAHGSEGDSRSDGPRFRRRFEVGCRNLEACGYPREQARWALSRCQGSPRARLNGALDLLLDGSGGGGGSGSGGGSAGTPVSPAKRPLELD